ncbi:hypothetical protein BFJ63_vAg1273 [Fusarium oxysporum f. sp. narcissi]|uniref:Uncharacterized protein n=1 Tax=Fusarium oxysporum f. sp. narcissi TaxID=451672 RepID=A0A4Q2W7M3_FUSOX|nr:hypothetical protein BFJ70_g9209 [Fusarium oxysporum]RYC95926.1 hypothetical protein BFJ63_vAg1273 [Fusarium oxysporum f. sp. narcissi]
MSIVTDFPHRPLHSGLYEQEGKMISTMIIDE